LGRAQSETRAALASAAARAKCTKLGEGTGRLRIGSRVHPPSPLDLNAIGHTTA